MRNDAVDEPGLERLVGRQQLRFEDQLECPRRPDRAREPLRPPAPGITPSVISGSPIARASSAM